MSDDKQFGIHKDSIARNLHRMTDEQKAVYFRNRREFLHERSGLESWSRRGGISGAEVSDDAFDLEDLWNSQEVLNEDDERIPWENRGEADWQARDLLKDGAHIEKESDDFA